MPSNAFFDRIKSDIAQELDRVTPTLNQVWREVSTMPTPPSPQEELDAWMQMPADQMQAMALELGPENYTALVKDKMQIAANIFGPSTAQTLMPYYMQYVQQPSVQEADYAAYMASYGGTIDPATGLPPVLDDPNAIDLESVIDRYLVDETEPG